MVTLQIKIRRMVLGSDLANSIAWWVERPWCKKITITHRNCYAGGNARFKVQGWFVIRQHRVAQQSLSHCPFILNERTLFYGGVWRMSSGVSQLCSLYLLNRFTINREPITGSAWGPRTVVLFIQLVIEHWQELQSSLNNLCLHQRQY